MDLTDCVDGASVGRSGYTVSRLALLSTGESNTGTVDCISSHHLKDFGVLFTRRSKSFLARQNIEKEIFNLFPDQSSVFKLDLESYFNLRTATSSTGLGVGTLTRLWRCELSICVRSSPGTARVRSLCGNCQMSDVANTGQGFSPKTIRAYGCQILERLEL